MSARTYWKLLVLFGVVCQGIIGTIAEKDIEESSELHLRQKRVINRNPGGDVKQMMRNVPYIVHVKQFNAREFCVGVILSTHVVLTLVKCVLYDIELYTVYAGSAKTSNRGNTLSRHSVREKILIRANNTHGSEEGIALMSVTPVFVFSVNTHSILLYEGQILPRSLGTVTGWGCHATGDPGTAYPAFLRSITVPIISNRDCATLHTDSFRILDSHICTFDSSGHQYCGANDDGAPLVITVSGVTKLVGIHVFSGRGAGGFSHPDVFLNLQYPRYKTLIAQNIYILNQNLDIGDHVHNPLNVHHP